MAKFGSKQIENTSKQLVKQILDNNLLEANKTLAKLVMLEQQAREKFIEQTLIEEADDSDTFSTILAGSSSPVDDNIAKEDDDDLEAGEAEAGEAGDDEIPEIPEIGNDEDEGGASPEELETGENIDDEANADIEDDIMGQAKVDEMSKAFADLNYKLNKAKINKLYNKISTLKSKLNALNLDTDEMKYVELDATLSFYSEALENLQQKSVPGIDGMEQTDISEKIEIINKALKTLASEIDRDDITDAADDAGSSEETFDEINADNGDIDADEDEEEEKKPSEEAAEAGIDGEGGEAEAPEKEEESAE